MGEAGFLFFARRQIPLGFCIRYLGLALHWAGTDGGNGGDEIAGVIYLGTLLLLASDNYILCEHWFSASCINLCVLDTARRIRRMDTPSLMTHSVGRPGLSRSWGKETRGWWRDNNRHCPPAARGGGSKGRRGSFADCEEI